MIRDRCRIVQENKIMRVLIIEDNQQHSSFIAQILDMEGHRWEIADNSTDGLHAARTKHFDALIVDRMLPGEFDDGLTLMKQLQNEAVNTPVIFVSAVYKESKDRGEGIRSGGIDYLVKPIEPEDLLARLDAIRRHVHTASPSAVLFLEDLTMNVQARVVKRGNFTIDLTPTEFRILEYLLRNKGHAVSRKMLAENAFKYNVVSQTNLIDVHISRLRGKIDNDDFDLRLLHTVRGFGYILHAEDES